jgi:hypothetical protein
LNDLPNETRADSALTMSRVFSARCNNGWVLMRKRSQLPGVTSTVHQVGDGRVLIVLRRPTFADRRRADQRPVVLTLSLQSPSELSPPPMPLAGCPRETVRRQNSPVHLRSRKAARSVGSSCSAMTLGTPNEEGRATTIDSNGGCVWRAAWSSVVRGRTIDFVASSPSAAMSPTIRPAFSCGPRPGGDFWSASRSTLLPPFAPQRSRPSVRNSPRADLWEANAINRR